MTERDDPRRDEDEGERLDREWLELLNEVRVVLPGVQVLFAFLLIVPFQQKFETLSNGQEDLYFGILLLAAVATALLMAPSAYHRLVFRQGLKPDLIRFSTRLIPAGLVCLALAMSGAVTLICDLIFGQTRSLIAGGALLIVYGWFWFAAGAIRRARSS